MMTWKEINKIEDRSAYERQYEVRKCYDKMTPIVDKIFTVFVFYAWSRGYYDIANNGANECWHRFVKYAHGTAIEDMISEMMTSPCAEELKKYFNIKVKQQQKFTGRKENDKNNDSKNSCH